MTEQSRAEVAFLFFISCGWTKEQAAGIVGNLMAESGRNLAFESATGDGGTAHGLAQWRFERVDKFEDVFGFPLSESSFEDQLNYVQWELTNPKSSEKRSGDRLKNADTASEAASIVDQYYERSSGEARGLRISYAQEILRKYGDEV